MRSPTNTVVLTMRGRAEILGDWKLGLSDDPDRTSNPPAAVSPTRRKAALNTALLPGAAKNSSSDPSRHSKATSRTRYRPAARLKTASESVGPRVLGNSNELVPISQRKPSSELTPNVHKPLVGIVILPMASVTKLSSSTPMIKPGKLTLFGKCPSAPLFRKLRTGAVSVKTLA